MFKTLIASVFIVLSPLVNAGVTLSEAVSMAASKNAQFLEQVELLSARGFFRDEERAKLLPQLKFYANYELDKRNISKSNIESGDSSRWGRERTYGLQLDQVIFNPVTNRRLLEIDEENAKAALELEAARLDLIQSTVEGYIETLRAQDMVDFYKGGINSNLVFVKQSWARFLDGSVREVEVLEAEADLMSALSSVDVAELNKMERMINLSESIGRKESSLFALSEAFDMASILPPISTNWYKVVDESNPELQAARLSTSIASRRIDTERAGYLPTLDFSASKENVWQDREFDGTREFDDRNETKFSLNLNWQLYDGGARQAAVSRLEKEKTAAVLGLKDVQKEVDIQIRLAQHRINSAVMKINAAKTRLIAKDRLVLERVKQYESGSTDVFPLLEARRELLRAKAEVRSSRYDLILEVVDIHRLAGTLDDGLIVRIEKLLSRDITVS